MEDCIEYGQQLNSQTMSIHYKIHYDSLQKNMAHYYNKSTITNVTTKSTLPLRSRSSEGTSGNNDSEYVGEARNEADFLNKMNKLVTLLTLRAEKENEHNERCPAAVVALLIPKQGKNNRHPTRSSGDRN